LFPLTIIKGEKRARERFLRTVRERENKKRGRDKEREREKK